MNTSTASVPELLPPPQRPQRPPRRRRRGGRFLSSLEAVPPPPLEAQLEAIAAELASCITSPDL